MIVRRAHERAHSLKTGLPWDKALLGLFAIRSQEERRQLPEFVATFGIRDGLNRSLRAPTVLFQFNLDTLEREFFLLLDCRRHAPDGSDRGLRRVALSRLPACARCGRVHNK